MVGRMDHPENVAVIPSQYCDPIRESRQDCPGELCCWVRGPLRQWSWKHTEEQALKPHGVFLQHAACVISDI